MNPILIHDTLHAFSMARRLNFLLPITSSRMPPEFAIELTVAVRKGAPAMTLTRISRVLFCTATLLPMLLPMFMPTPPAIAQEPGKLPDDFDEVIEIKAKALKAYAAQRESGDADAAVETLKSIIGLHRKALQLAEANSANEQMIGQLWQVLANDAEFLSDELLRRGLFAESAKLRDEVEALLKSRLGADNAATQQIHWKAITANKLKAASAANQKTWLASADIEARAREALQNEQPDLAAELYQQLVSAQVAVLGESHPDVASNLNELGRVLWTQEEFDRAEAIYKRSLKARETSAGRDLQYATTLFNLGRVYQSTERFEEAEQQYLATAEIEEPILGSRNESFLQTLQQLADLYSETENKGKLAEIQKRLAAADPLVSIMTHLPTGTYAAVAAQPSQLPQDPGLQMLPFEILETSGLEEFGFNPLDLDAVVAFMATPIAEPPFHFGVAMRFRDGVQPDFKWLADMEPVSFGDDQKYLKAPGDRPGTLCFFQFDDGVALIGTEEVIRQSLSSAGTTAVAEVLKADRNQGQLVAAADLKMIRGILAVAMTQTPAVPEPLESLKQLPLTTDMLKLSINMSAGLKLLMQLDTASADAAEQAADTIRNSMAFGMQMAIQQTEADLAGDQPLQVASRSYAQRMIRRYLSALQPTVSESSVVVQVDVMEHSIGPLAVALLLPAVQAARDAAQRTEDKNDMKQIGLALFNYEVVHGRLPARANYDDDGKPLLSWRVHLLPYLDEMALYEQFHLNEPWDSEHNIQLVEKMPDVFRTRQLDDISKTVYLTLDGPGTIMEGTEGIRLSQVTDGLSSTMLLVQANADHAVTWTKPDDLPFDAEKPADGLGAILKDGFFAAFADGAVQLIPNSIDPETLSNLAIRNDGKAVGDF